MTYDTHDGKCKRCAEEITLDSTVCSHCGFDGGGLHEKASRWLTIGMMLCIPIVTIPLGLPIIATTLPIVMVTSENKAATPLERAKAA